MSLTNALAYNMLYHKGALLLMAKNRKFHRLKRVPSNYDPRQELLRRHLEPLLDQLHKEGWIKQLMGSAVVEHYARSGKEIFPEDLTELLSDPAELIIKYKKHRGKPNNPTSQQLAVLNRLIPDSNNRQKTAQILSKAYVVDLLPPLAFRQIVKEIRSHDFVDPQVQSCSSQQCCQGRQLIWPEH